MTYAIVAEERSGRRIVGSVALSAVSCVASRRRIVAGAISAWRVIGCAIVVRPTVVVGRSQRAADNGAAEESGSKAPTKSPTPHRLHIACGRLSDRKRIDEWRGRCHIGGTRSTRCEHCGDRYVEHSPGHWLSPSFRALGSGLRGGYTRTTGHCAQICDRNSTWQIDSSNPGHRRAASLVVRSRRYGHILPPAAHYQLGSMVRLA